MVTMAATRLADLGFRLLRTSDSNIAQQIVTQDKLTVNV